MRAAAPVSREDHGRGGDARRPAAAASSGAPGDAASTVPGTASGPSSGNASLTLYTSVTQETVDTITAGYQQHYPGAKVTVFRAPDRQLNARIAADLRSGGLQADVIWGTDPLSMQSYTDQNLLAPWPLPELTTVPDSTGRRSSGGPGCLPGPSSRSMACSRHRRAGRT